MERNYTITIKNDTDSGGDSPISGESKKKAAKGNAAAKDIVKSLVAYNTYIKPFVSSTVGHHISTISLRTGAEEYQQKLQFAYDMAESAVSIGSSILVGFAIGNVHGAIIGAIVGVTTKLVNYANNVEKRNMQNSLEDISIRAMNARAGGSISSFSGSRSVRQ